MKQSRKVGRGRGLWTYLPGRSMGPHVERLHHTPATSLIHVKGEVACPGAPSMLGQCRFDPRVDCECPRIVGHIVIHSGGQTDHPIDLWTMATDVPTAQPPPRAIHRCWVARRRRGRSANATDLPNRLHFVFMYPLPSSSYKMRCMAQWRSSPSIQAFYTSPSEAHQKCSLENSSQLVVIKQSRARLGVRKSLLVWQSSSCNLSFYHLLYSVLYIVKYFIQ